MHQPRVQGHALQNLERAAALGLVYRLLGTLEHGHDVARRFGHDLGKGFEVADEARGNLGRALAHVGVGAMRALRAHGKLQPQRSFLAEPYRIGATGFAVQTGIAVNLGVMLHQIARAVRTEGFLVRNAGERQTALQAIAHAVQIGKGKNRCRGAALHIGRAAAPNLTIVHGAAPRRLRPGLVFVYEGGVR